MKLHEYQSKTIFSKYGIPIPKGRVAATADEAKQIAEELGGRAVIKAHRCWWADAARQAG